MSSPGRHLSKWVVQPARMRLRYLFPELDRQDGQTIATFGRARLVKRWDAGFDLIGGTDADRREAQEWISLFLHEAVPSTPRPGSARRNEWERR